MSRAALALLGVLLATAGPAVGDRQALPLWQVEGDANTVYLLGSVHLLRPADYPLPDEFYAAYADAETLVMELDLDDLEPAAVAATMTSLGHVADGGSLAALLGETSYRRAVVLAEAADIPLARLSRTEPWLAAISIEQWLLTRLGFEPALGVESHFAERAAADGKPIRGLETPGEQLGVLDGLTLDAQRRLLLRTLEDSATMPAAMEEIMRAWRAGDLAALEASMLADLQVEPELYRALVAARNCAWTLEIEALLDDDQDYLVVVGALHLVGEDGVPRLLGQRGYRVEQAGRAAPR